MAEGALRAIPVVAAFSADRVLGVPVLAADEAVAAIELRTAIGGLDQETAGLMGAPAAVAEIDALTLAAFFTL
jgi:hypothetical protein